MDLRPAGDPGQHLEPAALALGVALDLVAERRARPDQAHVAADDVPQLRQLVERGAAQKGTDPRDPAVALLDCVAGTLRSAPTTIVRSFRSSKSPVLADAGLLEEDRAAVRELHRDRRGREQRAAVIARPAPAIATSSARFSASPPPPPTSRARRGGGSSRARRRSPR